MLMNPYVVQGGFQSWTKQGIRIKELKPETALSILNEEAEAILEDVSPSPLQLLGYGTNKSTFLFSISCFHLGNLENTSLLIPNTVLNSLSDERSLSNIKCRRSEATSCPGGSESTSVDPINEEKLRNKSWIDAAGGITNRGILYGVGKVGSALRLGDAFPNLSCGRSTQESEKILQLGTRVRQSREEARRSREEARRSRSKMNACNAAESLFNALFYLFYLRYTTTFATTSKYAT
ncbi:hypothetical protein Fmac_031960 [Flemingia macrophylla]|uniref:Uncharacterized protein n=1 Tax=Flemingia macrophylla TaxID=520843 RepID=A0ABD1L3J6_9FABA